jgi:hypothetical protein
MHLMVLQYSVSSEKTSVHVTCRDDRLRRADPLPSLLFLCASSAACLLVAQETRLYGRLMIEDEGCYLIYCLWGARHLTSPFEKWVRVGIY